MQMNAAAIWINSTFADFDLTVTRLINRLAQSAGEFFTPFMEFASFLCKDGILLIILAIALMLFRKTRRFGTAMLAGLTIGAILTNCCLKILIARARPYADQTSEFYQMWLTVGMNMESDKSFPSGHTTAAFASMTGLFLTSRKKYISWTLFLFSFLVAVSRIYLVVHFPSDVVAGMIVGIIGGVLGYLFMRKLPREFYASRKPYALNGGKPASSAVSSKASSLSSLSAAPADARTRETYGKHCSGSVSDSPSSGKGGKHCR